MKEITIIGGGKLVMKAMISYPSSAITSSTPLLVFLHGIGENADKRPALENVLKYGPLQQLSEGVDIGPANHWIIVHPQNPSGDFTVAEIQATIQHCKNSYAVDEDCIYLMGCSNGGSGVWAYAQDPELVKTIAAIVPICGGKNDLTKAHILAQEGIPGWAAHAENDPVVPYHRTKSMVNAVNQIAGRAQILFSEYGMYGHSAWNYFLRPQYGVYDWLSFQRVSNRKRKGGGSLTLQIDYSADNGFSFKQI